MTFPNHEPAVTWRKNPLMRFAGAFSSWVLFAFSCTVLVLSAFTVLAIGGSCATGGPYQIAVQCPASNFFSTLGVVLGLVAVGIGIFFGQGFGTPLSDLAWPILFCGLGFIFLIPFFVDGDITSLVMGGFFEIMGVAPLILAFVVSFQRTLIGSITVGGHRFYEGEKERKQLIGIRPKPSATTVHANPGHWMLSLTITVVACLAGIALGQLAFALV